MKRKVDFYTFDAGQDKKVGSLSWDGIHLKILGDSSLLEFLLDIPVPSFGRLPMISSVKDPGAFLENLQYQYKSVSLRASAPYQEDK